jgi:hypothetical protein
MENKEGKTDNELIGFKDNKPVLYSSNSYSPIIIKDSHDILTELMGKPCFWIRSKKTPLTTNYKSEIRCDDSYALCGDMRNCEACGAYPIAIITKI